MDKYSRYYGIATFVLIIFIAGMFGYNTLKQSLNQLISINSQAVNKEQEYNKKLEQKRIVERKLAQMKVAMTSIQKKVYAPVDSDLGNDTLFFTLYNDLIEMLHANSIKIKSIEYLYNPESDAFVKFSKDQYFVSEVNMELVSNYTNLGKFIQDVIQYPYYIRIVSINIKPYPKDKKILVSDISMRLYAHTNPETPMED